MNLPRIQELRLTQPPPAWSVISQSLPQLAILSINRKTPRLGGRHRGGIFYPNTPLLHQLSLRYTGYERHIQLDLHWSTITIVNLRSVPLQDCFELLVRCPNLIEYLCTESTFTPGFISFASQPDTVVLQHLVSFGWDFEPAHAWYFRGIRFPSLKMLLLRGGRNDFPEIPFLEHLPSTLRTLHLQDFRANTGASCCLLDEHLESDHPSAENIEHLILENNSYSDLLEEIMLRWRSQRILPNVKKLTIRQGLRLRQKDIYGSRHRSTRLVDVVLVRATAPNPVHASCTAITLVFEGLRSEWQVYKRKALKFLLSQGWSFKIIDDWERATQWL